MFIFYGSINFQSWYILLCKWQQVTNKRIKHIKLRNRKCHFQTRCHVFFVSCVCSEKITNFTTEQLSPTLKHVWEKIKKIDWVRSGTIALETTIMKIFLAILLFVLLNSTFGKQEGMARQFGHCFAWVSNPWFFGRFEQPSFRISTETLNYE